MTKGLEIEKVADLTPLQEGMLFQTVMEPESLAYYEQLRLDLRGELNLDALCRCFQLLVQRHEVFRSNIYYNGTSRSRLVILKERNAIISYEDYTKMSQHEQTEAIRNYMEADRNKGYDLSKDMLIRFAVLQSAPNAFTLLLSFHHIIMDGWCLGILMDEMFAAYEALQAGRPVGLPEPQAYTGYSKWLNQQDKEAALAYWRSMLSGYEQPVGMSMLQTGHPSQKKSGYLLREKKTMLSEDITRQLRAIAEKSSATLSSLFLAAWGFVLARYNQREDVVFGTVVSGRPPELDGVEKIIGLFINSIPVRITIHSEQAFTALVREVQQAAVRSKAYEYCSLAEVQTHSDLKQQLLDHIIVFENYPLENLVGRLDLEERLGFIIEDAQLSEEIPYDFNIEVEDGIKMNFILSYNGYAYEDEAMSRLAGHLENVFYQIVQYPDILIKNIHLITEAEKYEYTNIWSGPSVDFPVLTFHGLFEAQAKLMPDEPAVIYEQDILTYRQLNEKANQLAQALQKSGVKLDSLVAVMMERSVDMVVSVLGIMKAGAAYVPIDPAYPKERIAYMLRDSGASFVITQQSLRSLLENMDFKGEVVVLSELLCQPDNHPELQESSFTPIYQPDGLAYVIYTSGTTGNAKGVMVEHQHYVNTALGYKHAQGFSDFQVKLLQIASMSFDVFACDMAKTFGNGGTMVICPESARNDPSSLAKILEEQEITTFEVPPVLLAVLMNYVYEHGTDISKVKLITTGADSLKVEDYRVILSRFGDKIRILNTYGVTEAAIESSYYEGMVGSLPPSGIVPIGKALPNHKLYILDDALRPLPVGVAGELCIGGASVSRGYLNRPELTAEKFIPNPFSEGGRLYRTGDLARWLPDGNIDFVGRLDHQVKIRGYRIEPGEIESALLRQQDVHQAVVIERTDKTGQNYLCAYVVGDTDTTTLKEELARELPSYMLPAHIVMLDQLPLSYNGKLERRALPEPVGLLHRGVVYEAPQNELEEVLVSIWEDVIGVKPIGLSHNFFELGGDSIKALQISIRLKTKGLKMDLKDLFRYPQIKHLLPYIKKINRTIPQGIVQGPIDLTPIQWEFFENHRINRSHYNQAVMLENSERWNETWLNSAIDKLTRHHDALRMVFVEDETGTSAYNRGLDEGELYSLESYNLISSAHPEFDILQISNKLQAKFNLRRGPLIRLALFRTLKADHLLIVIHHLVVDGVSWRILLEDLGTAYQQAAEGKEIQLPDKTDSYKEWAARLSMYAKSSQAIQEISYWNRIGARQFDRLPRDFVVPSEQACELKKSEVKLGREETETLLKHVHHAYNTEINDLLLTALGLAFWEWSGRNEIPILLEGHGREELLKDVDISRTVGWFTSIFPVVLEINRPGDLAYQIKTVKDGLRRVPNKGIGYGILRYLTMRNASEPASLVSSRLTEISFNYLGQLDEENENTMPWHTSSFAAFAGNESGSKSENPMAFDINGMIMNGSLCFTFEYNGFEYEASTVEKLTACYRKHLLELIRHCASKATTEQSPTDFTYGQLSIGQLENISNDLTKKLLKNLK